MGNSTKKHASVERSLRMIYAILFLSVVLLEIFFVIALFPLSRFLEFASVNVGGIVIGVLTNYSLRGILRKNPSLRMYIREELWILIVVSVILSYGVREPTGITFMNISTLTGPSLLLGASFLISQMSVSALKKINRWQAIGIQSKEIPDILEKIDHVFENKEHQELSSVYGNVRYLPLLFVTEQANLILTHISGMFDKLIDESFQILSIPIPVDENGRGPGYVRKATYLGLNLSLNNSTFDFGDFWRMRSKYTHHAMDKATEIVPSEKEIENSIELLSKTLREYPSIMHNFDSSNASW